MNTLICNTPVGVVKIIVENKNVYALEFVNDAVTEVLPAFLTDYFDNKPCPINYVMNGTAFQLLVWKEIALIPWGCTKTYSDIALIVGRPKAVRAVANACGKNKICLLIPCHRVVGKNNIGGYSFGIHIKKKLLALEQNFI
jgi:O-6-methylguanine DNA methyltransferase